MNETLSSVDVLVLAAGFGTRLKPLTDTTPKPLVEVGGRPLIEWWMRRLAHAGVRRVIVNVHYLGERIREYLGGGAKWNLKIEYSPEDPILDTGGAILRCEPLRQHRELLLINSDVLVGKDFSLTSLVDYHRSCGGIATMALRDDPESDAYGSVETDVSGAVSGFLGTHYGASESVRKQMYLGVSVIDASIVRYMPPGKEVFSITRDVYVKALSQGEPLYGWTYDGYWSDVGTHERLAAAKATNVAIYNI